MNMERCRQDSQWWVERLLKAARETHLLVSRGAVGVIGIRTRGGRGRTRGIPPRLESSEYPREKPEDVLRDLESCSPDLRRKVVSELKNRGDEIEEEILFQEILPPLSCDKDADVRIESIKLAASLRTLRPESMLRDMAENDTDARVRESAASFLNS